MSDAGWIVNSEPQGPVDVPAALAAAFPESELRCVWCNALGGLTFEMPTEDRFVKWTPADSAQRLNDEMDRLRWVDRYTPVPRVVDAGTGRDGSAWFVTVRVPGTTAVAERWRAEPAVAVRAIGAGLRAFHDAVPTTGCPFDWSAERRIANALQRAEAGSTDRAEWHPSHRSMTVDDALAAITDPPPVDRLVVCHGDACSPNTLIGDDGRWSGHVDLGSMGTGDRWADLAIATWSSEWNYGPGWEDELLAAYGLEPDPERTRYYRLLWDLTD